MHPPLVKHPKPSRRTFAPFHVLLIAAIAAQLWTIWRYPYFPSQDGPAHLYNAGLLAWLDNWDTARRYFEVRFTLAGNVTGHLVLASLMRAVSPVAAEKILLGCIVVCHAVSVWVLTRAFRAKAPEVGLWAVLLGQGQLLYMGFWNFCLAAGAILAAVGLTVLARERAGRGRLAVCAALSGAMYFSHSTAWAASAAAALLYLALDHVLRHGRSWWAGLKADARRLAGLAAAVLWPAAILLVYLLTSERLTSETDQLLRSKAWTFYSGAFLGTIPAALPLRYLFMGFAAAMPVVAIVFRFLRRIGPAPSDSLLLSAGLFMAATLFAPDQLGSGAYLTSRFALMTALALVGWLGCQPWPAWVRAVLGTCLVAAVLLQTRANLTEVRRWQPAIRELASLRSVIPEGSVVLPVLANRDKSLGYDPLLHAAGYWTPKDFVYLRNYQAFRPHFCVSFRPEYSPDGRLGEPRAMDAAPAKFSIAQYEARTRGRVDLVILYGPFPEKIETVLPQASWDPDSAFELKMVSSPNGLARIYGRR